MRYINLRLLTYLLTGYGFLSVFYSNFVPKMHRFEIYLTSKVPWPWKPG